MKKILKLLYKIFKISLVVFIILFVLVVCLQRFSNNSISIFSFRMFSVISGSMDPDYKIGDVLLCKETDPSKLKIGDDVSYLGKSGSTKGKIITHRIVNIGNDEDGSYLFTTKGLASSAADPVVNESQLYGKIITKLTVLSLIYKMVISPVGFYLGIFIPIIVLIGSEIIESALDRYKEKHHIVS